MNYECSHPIKINTELTADYMEKYSRYHCIIVMMPLQQQQLRLKFCLCPRCQSMSMSPFASVSNSEWMHFNVSLRIGFGRILHNSDVNERRQSEKNVLDRAHWIYQAENDKLQTWFTVVATKCYWYLCSWCCWHSIHQHRTHFHPIFWYILLNIPWQKSHYENLNSNAAGIASVQARKGQRATVRTIKHANQRRKKERKKKNHCIWMIFCSVWLQCIAVKCTSCTF